MEARILCEIISGGQGQKLSDFLKILAFFIFFWDFFIGGAKNCLFGMSVKRHANQTARNKHEIWLNRVEKTLFFR